MPIRVFGIRMVWRYVKDTTFVGRDKLPGQETGSNLVVWTDGREERIALIGQLYSPQGDPQWGHNGMLLARSEGIGIYDPEIVRSEDGWFAFWFDYDIRIEGEDEIYAGSPSQ